MYIYVYIVALITENTTFHRFLLKVSFNCRRISKCAARSAVDSTRLPYRFTIMYLRIANISQGLLTRLPNSTARHNKSAFESSQLLNC